MAKVIDLSALDSTQGFIIQGDGIYDNAGYSVSSAGDVNGDGIDDLIVGVPFGDDGGYETGEAYVIFGRDVAGGAAAFGNIDLTSLDPADGFIIQGAVNYGYVGYSVSSAGDVNGDGIADLIVGAPYGNGTGKAHVIFGRDVAGGAASFGTIDLTALDPADGFTIEGDTNYDYAGYSVSSAGDVNGDGIADLIVGAHFGDDGGADAGEAYVIFGRDVAGGATPFGTIDLATLAPADGIIIQGNDDYDNAGCSVSSAGDVNGDGIADLIVGARMADGSGAGTGAAYVIFGRDVAGGAAAFGTIDITSLDPADGFIIEGAGDGDQTGYSVSGTGDVNGDGIDDLIVGAPYGDGGAPDAGQAWVIYGRDVAGGAPAFGTIDLLALDPADGFSILGDRGSDLAGYSVSSAGDVNGDGIADMIVGAPVGDDGPENAGEAYVIYGRDVTGGAAPFGTIDLAALDPADGFIIQGYEADGRVGSSVSSAGDVNGDGYDDLVVGGPQVTSQTGEAYVIYGGPGPLALSGDGANDTLTGGTNDDDLRGSGGNDVLRGGGGNDELRGSRGNDRLHGNEGDDRLFGGIGDDTLSGNDGDDVLFGRAGNDVLKGGLGADTLDGGAGVDTLKGGAGPDLLRGGAGNDRFIFGDVDHTPAGAGDTIADFETGDLIRLGRIDADATSGGTNEAFTWIADAAFTGAAGELRYEIVGLDLVVQGDTDGNGAADLEITLTGVSVLTDADFVL
ncbi:MAG: hypothetical protein R3D59_15790 [Paracoccaceae bacterium]